MRTKHKIITGIVAAIATVGTYLFVSQPISHPTGFKGFYDNDLSSYLGIPAKEDAQIAWHVKNGDNSVAIYGLGNLINSSSNYPKIANLIRKYKRKGIDVGFIYSSTSTLNGLNSYQSSQSTDSTKFKFIVAEIEPYNTGDYAGFYVTIRAFSNWALKQSPKVERAVYIGWETAVALDSIVTNSDRTYVHAYLQPAQMTGAGIRGYTKGRTGTIAGIVNTKYASNPTFKYSIVLLLSCEPTFAGPYFSTHTWDQPFTDYLNYYNTTATTTEKNRLQISGRQIFVSRYAIALKP